MPERVRKPEWLKISIGANERYTETKRIVESHCLHTICSSGRCPNMGECWGKGTATFMIGGNICTRCCKFCNTASGKPLPLDADEPTHVAESIALMKLSHAVVTSVDRDDLPDLGASHWVRTIREIKRLNPDTTVEVLIPDFQGRKELVAQVIDAQPEIISHNMETVRRISPLVRSAAKYDTSLEVLRQIADSGITTKSGIMVGLGETPEEVEELMDDLRRAGCHILTIGQYLQPSHKHYPVAAYITPEQFARYKETGLEKGFLQVESAPLVRSSYHAEKQIHLIQKKSKQETFHAPNCYDVNDEIIIGTMSHQRILSSRFNMSLGFIPVIISILLCEFITQDMSIYIGAGVGLLFSIYSVKQRGTHVPQIILYSTTGMLLLLSVATAFPVNHCPLFLFPFALEISAIIPPFFIYFNRRSFLDYHMSQTQKCCKQLFAQGAEAAIVSARVILIISLLHFLVISLAILVSYPLGDTTRYILFYVAPPLVFISGILFNQFGIFYFNIVMNHTVFVPIVNAQGDVTGKAIASEAINRKNDYINPVIRIAVASHGMLFLLPRPKCNIFEKGRIDLLMEDYLIYGETLEQGAHRIVQQTLPTAPLDHLRFNLMYHFENEATNRLIYLFTLDLDDDFLLCNKNFKGGKLWTFRQMEHNLGQHFFGSCLEYEFEHLEAIIYTREKYKGF